MTATLTIRRPSAAGRGRSRWERLLPGMCAGLGLLAMVTVALGGHATGSGHLPASRWFWGTSPLDDRSLGGTEAVIVLRLAILVLVGAWLGLGLLLHQRLVTIRTVVVIAILWSLPLIVVAPLFSDDAHLYVAYGDLARRGLDPYTVTPAALGTLPDVHGVDGFWLNYSSPYGGLFLDVMSLIVRITGERPHAALLVLRGVIVLALGLLVLLLTRLAAALGRPVEPVLWLVLLNPLVLFSTVSGLHNDVLMLVPLAAGVLLAVQQRWLLAISACAVAANVKVVAVLALAVIVADYAWHGRTWPGRIGRLLGGSVLGVVVFGGVGLATLHGFGWARDLDVPGKAFTLITPVDSLVLFQGHVSLDQARPAAIALTALAAVLAALAARRIGAVRASGAALAVGVVLGIVLWPWYWVWPVALFAVAGSARERAVMAVGSVALLFVTLPSGVPDFGTANNRLIGPHAAETIALVLAGFALLTLLWEGLRQTDIHLTGTSPRS